MEGQSSEQEGYTQEWYASLNVWYDDSGPGGTEWHEGQWDSHDPNSTSWETPNEWTSTASSSQQAAPNTGGSIQMLGGLDLCAVEEWDWNTMKTTNVRTVQSNRKIVIRTLPEDTGCPSGFAVLDKSMYGTKDAAQCFDVACENAMTKMGYTIGLFSPCLYMHKIKRLAVFRHGDDSVVCGTRTQQAEFKSELGQYFIVKQLAILGPCQALGEVPEVRILNRLVRWVKPPYGSGAERLDYEADPRHAELLVHQLGLSCSSKGVSTPGEKSKPSVDFGTLLGRDEHILYRSATMRLCYLALDRPDLQFSSKELARWMQRPTVGDFEGLKRAARYLVRHRRLVQEFVRQFEEPQHLVVFTDSNHAGCLRTRKSTSSFKIMYGQHLLRSASSTQAVISLSSGESEFYSLVKGVAAGLGAVAMLRDLGVKLTGDATVEVKVDATAGRGVAMRRGAGRIRHIATPTLWVQKMVQDGKVKVSKIPGNTNPADLGSKHLDAASIQKHLARCKFAFRAGRSDIALRAEIQDEQLRTEDQNS